MDQQRSHTLLRFVRLRDDLKPVPIYTGDPVAPISAEWLAITFVPATPKCVVESYVIFFLDCDGRELEFLSFDTLEIAFQLGATDAELFERHFGQALTADNLMNIPKYHAYCRLLLDGMPSRPFSMETIAPHQVQFRRANIIRRVSRQNYAISVRQRKH